MAARLPLREKLPKCGKDTIYVGFIGGCGFLQRERTRDVIDASKGLQSRIYKDVFRFGETGDAKIDSHSCVHLMWGRSCQLNPPLAEYATDSLATRKRQPIASSHKLAPMSAGLLS